MTAMSSSIRPQDFPMFIAVYFLSPVSIQTLIPAFLNLIMVSLTLSCSLSSMAVDPIRVSYFSRISYNYEDEHELEESILFKYLSMKIFCLSLRTLLSFSNVFMADSGVSISKFSEARFWSSMMSLLMVSKDKIVYADFMGYPSASNDNFLMNYFFSLVFYVFSTYSSRLREYAYILAHFS